MLSLKDNPPFLFPAGLDLADVAHSWWVAHTKARFEKAFAWELHSRQIPFFLPMVERLRIIDGRKRKVKLPIFPGYVFFNGDSEARYAALTTNRLCQVIEVKDQPRLIDELADIRRIIESGIAIDPYPQAAAGQRYRITAGPLEGIEGILIRRGTASRFVVEVSILGRGAEVEIQPDLLELIDEHHRPRGLAHSSLSPVSGERAGVRGVEQSITARQTARNGSGQRRTMFTT